MTAYERWIWIELIGFDNTLGDFGVAEYIERIGFVPDGMCVLLFTPDFVHAHAGMDQEYALPVEVCSYNARPYGRDRNRQSWTNVQLRGLVSELRKFGVPVYCSFFDLFHAHGDRDGEWCGAHPELYETGRRGERFGFINPLKHFADGSLYEDLFIRELLIVMQDYGFDGYHGADGYTSPRKCLAETDYSDDMIGQFARYAGISFEGAFAEACDGDPDAMERRASWIWRSRRLDWISFHSRRWAAFWQKIVDAVHGAGKKTCVNTAWTREPMEALYRYGVDYKLLAETGIDGFIVESVGASLSAGADETEYEPGTEFMTMIMTIKAYVPDTKLICLNAIQDTNEQWDTLRHAPTVLERDIFAFSNVYLKELEGIRRASSGFMACLGDGISRDSWQWLTSRWQLGFDSQPQDIAGPTLVWSDKALHHSLEDYVDSREWPVHKWTNELIDRGVPLHGVVNVRDLPRTEGAIVATCVHALPEDELRELLAYRGGRAVLIGRMTESIAALAAVEGLSLACAIGDYFCAAREADGSLDHLVAAQNEAGWAQWQEKTGEINDAIIWLDRLAFSPVPDAFVDSCAQTAAKHTGAPQALANADYIRTIALEMAPNRWRVLIRNLHLNYKIAKLDVGRTIAAVRVMTDFPGIPVFPDDSRFRLYVPGRGMVVVELEF